MLRSTAINSMIAFQIWFMNIHCNLLWFIYICGKILMDNHVLDFVITGVSQSICTLDASLRSALLMNQTPQKDNFLSQMVSYGILNTLMIYLYSYSNIFSLIHILQEVFHICHIFPRVRYLKNIDYYKISSC